MKTGGKGKLRKGKGRAVVWVAEIFITYLKGTRCITVSNTFEDFF